MKREVWVEASVLDTAGIRLFSRSTCLDIILKKLTIEESRWIPVEERMPDKPGHYHVFRLDREDWCYCEINEEFNCKPYMIFTSKGVTHWLESPPLPEDQDEKAFNEWFDKKLAEFNWTSRDTDLLRDGFMGGRASK